MHEKTEHQRSVESFLRGIGRPVPDSPEIPSIQLLQTWGNLLVEEVFELLQAAGLGISIQDSYNRGEPLQAQDIRLNIKQFPSLVELIDGTADVAVINTGIMSLCGVADMDILREVDANNLQKVGRGHIDLASGKYIKPVDHVKPDLGQCLRRQGWQKGTDE